MLPRHFTLALTAAGFMCLPAAAFGDHPSGLDQRESAGAPEAGSVIPKTTDRLVPERVQDVLGPGTEVTRTGDYAVEVKGGPDLLTHGPDFQIERGTANHGTGLGPGDPERAPACTTNENQHGFQRVLYAFPTGGPNNLAAVTADIRSAIRRMNAVLNEEAMESSGNAVTADYRVLCDGGNNIRVDAFAVSGSSFQSHVNAAINAGFSDIDADYTIFSEVPAGNACGVGSHYSDERPTSVNFNNNASGAGSGYAVNFDGCWLNETPMHEAGHNQGATQYNAPDSTGTGAHCYDEHDVMCYSPDGGDQHQNGTTLFCSDKLHYDCGHDTYFDAATESGEYLASNWNLGSSANQFVVFGTPSGGNTPPTAAFNVGCNGHTCQFDDMSTESDPGDAITSWNWSFGDGNTSTQQNPTHNYANAGTYTVTLTVSDGTASSSTVRTVVVDDPNPGTVEIFNGVSEFGSTGEPGSWRDFAIQVPQNRSQLKVVLDGPACDYSGCASDLDLYVQRNALPELDSYVCRPYQADSDERCTIRRPRGGVWYVSVYNYAGPAQSPFRVKATHRR